MSSCHIQVDTTDPFNKQVGLVFVYYTTKAWENAYVMEFRPYMQNGCEQRKKRCWLKDILDPC